MTSEVLFCECVEHLIVVGHLFKIVTDAGLGLHDVVSSYVVAVHISELAGVSVSSDLIVEFAYMLLVFLCFADIDLFHVGE